MKIAIADDSKLNITVFVSGAVVMVLEIAGSRAIAPYLGTSLFTWTSIIGVILASLSLGYWWGGKLADQNPDFSKLGYILSFASLSIFITNIIKDALLIGIAGLFPDPRVASTIAGLLLFSVPSVSLGMVSPYAARLKLTKIKTSGETVGALYALSTIGSIVGTFLTGFVLFSYFGTSNILFSLSITLSFLAILNLYKTTKITKELLLMLLYIAIYSLSQSADIFTSALLLSKDTAYQRVRILDLPEKNTNRIKRYMLLNDQHSSAIYLDTKESSFEYIKFWKVAEHFVPGFKNALALGGAGFTYPFYFVETYPDATITVIEIDPELYGIAKKHFDFRDNDRLSVVNADARLYLNSNTQKYDVIFGDAFNAQHSVPFQLTTIEAIEHIYNALDEDGVYILNIISSLGGSSSGFFQAEYVTLKEVFPHVLVFPITSKDPNKLQNIAMVALKSDVVTELQTENTIYSELLSKLYNTNDLTIDAKTLTDELAPVEKFALDSYVR